MSKWLHFSGYLGAGGLSGAASATDLPNQNCTGGAAGKVDRVLLGESHTYQSPTCVVSC